MRGSILQAASQLGSRATRQGCATPLCRPTSKKQTNGGRLKSPLLSTDESLGDMKTELKISL